MDLAAEPLGAPPALESAGALLTAEAWQGGDRGGPRPRPAAQGLAKGLDEAQKKALDPLSGIGTDLTVTRKAQHDQDRPSSGSVVFEGRDLATLADGALAELRLRSFGFVLRPFNLIPTLTAAENVEAKLAPTGVEGRAARAHACTARRGRPRRSREAPAVASLGRRAAAGRDRAGALGRAAGDPRGRPTGKLDSRTGADVIELLAGLATQRGTTVVVAAHDAGLAERAPRRLAMRDGGLRAAVPA